MYSLGGRPDAAIFQQRVRLHPAFEPVAFQGIPDVRVILYRGEPAMAMLRLPTKESGGRANLHQGGIGAGVGNDGAAAIFSPGVGAGGVGMGGAGAGGATTTFSGSLAGGLEGR